MVIQNRISGSKYGWFDQWVWVGVTSVQIHTTGVGSIVPFVNSIWIQNRHKLEDKPRREEKTDNEVSFKYALHYVVCIVCARWVGQGLFSILYSSFLPEQSLLNTVQYNIHFDIP